jgi:hypothetical protein
LNIFQHPFTAHYQSVRNGLDGPSRKKIEHPFSACLTGSIVSALKQAQRNRLHIAIIEGAVWHPKLDAGLPLIYSLQIKARLTNASKVLPL